MSRVVIRAIHPVGLHGFTAGQLGLSDLAEGMNVVYAPNATGKSTLARAVGILLNPARCDEGASVAGEVQLDGVVSPRNVRRKDLPLEGVPERVEDYSLDIVRLLQGFREKGDAALLGRLVGNGLNLDPGRRPRFTTPQEVRRAREQRDTLFRARAEKSALAQLEDRIPELERRLDECTAAEEAIGALKGVLDQRGLRRALDQLRGRTEELISRYPGVERQTEGASEAVAGQLQAFRQAAAAERIAAAALLEVHPDGALPQTPLSLSDRERLRSAVTAVYSALELCAQEEAHLAREQARACGARDTVLRLFPADDPTELPLPTGEDLDRLRECASEQDRVREAQARQAGFAQALAEWREASGEPDHRVSDLELSHAAHDLCEWLSTPPATARAFPLAEAAAVIAVAVLVVAVVSDAPTRLAVAALMVLCIAGALCLLRMRKPDGRKDPDSHLRKLLEGVNGEASVTPEAVATALTRVLEYRAHREAGRTLASLAGQPLPESTWLEAAAHLRIRSSDPYRLSSLCESLRRYFQARDGVAEHTSLFDSARGRLEAARRQVSAVLSSYGFPVTREAPETDYTAFLAWFERSDALRQAQRNSGDAVSRLTELLDTYGVPPGANPEIRCRNLQQREPASSQYRRLASEIEGAQRDLHLLRVDLALAADAYHSVTASEAPAAIRDDWPPDEELARARHLLEERLARRETWRQSLADLRAALAQGEASTGVARAEAAYGTTLSTVELRWGELVRQDVRHRVRSVVADRLRRVALPEIVTRANELLERFSGHRYRLRLGTSTDEGLGVLRVWDRERDSEQRFAELSTGTKVHVALALRIGLLQEHERAANGGTRQFPLLADEALAVSDTQASEAVAQVLLEVSRDRQVILFTNQLEDVRLLQRLEPEVAIHALSGSLARCGSSAP